MKRVGEELYGRVPYRNLQNEIELQSATLDVDDLRPNPTRESPDLGSEALSTSQNHFSIASLALSCCVAAGVQFGWALQLSLLTPYIQTLGIDHAFSSFIWLCGPITGLVVQPCVGMLSDKCTSRLGRRRPFILAGSLMISLAVIIIGFSADIGYFLGDTKEHCSTYKGSRPRAAFVFVFGFWLLDLANNTVQGPARALLADLSGPNQRNLVNAVFCLWMAVGNIIGFSAGASGSWNRWFPFLRSQACCEACGNLKAAFLVAVVFLLLCTLITLYFADEVPLVEADPRVSDLDPLMKTNGNPETVHTSEVAEFAPPEGIGSVLVNILTSLRHLPDGMDSVLVVMAFTWLSWFPFFLFDTDWMGREVFHGDPKGSPDEVKLYDRGVREGAFGLLLNSVVLGVSSFVIEPMCRRIGSRLVWALSNLVVFACMAGTGVIGVLSSGGHSNGVGHALGDSSGKIPAVIVFALLGFPLAITYSVPFSVTAELTAGSGGGQGLAIGVLNLAIVIPQMIVSLGAGPWDALFGGGNTPAFALASLCALLASLFALLRLPNLSSNSSAFHFG